MDKKLFKLLSLALALSSAPVFADGIIIIGHQGMPRLDAVTIQKLFTGRMIEVEGQLITAVNASTGSQARNQFLDSFLAQDEEKYTAYWTVRRFIGKGAPPRELQSSADVVNFVQSHPGGIGYIPSSELKPGLNVLSRK